VTPSYLDVLEDDENSTSRENPVSDYEVPSPNQSSVHNLMVRRYMNLEYNGLSMGICTETVQPRKEYPIEQPKQIDDKGTPIYSLNLLDCECASISGMPEKCKTLDSAKSANSVAKAALKFSSLNGHRKYNSRSNRRRDSEASIGECKSNSSHSPAPSTRPSSSVINSQTALMSLENINVIENGEVGSPNETTLAKNTLKIARTYSNVQNGKTKIPLVIDNVPLNLVKQTAEHE